MKKLSLLLCLLFASFKNFAVIHHVPADYSTIQLALDVSAQGDTVLVEPGTYFENITWPDINGIKLISNGDSSNTIIDGSGSDLVLYLYSQVIDYDTTTLIRGFKITNGYADEDSSAGGAGIQLEQAGATFENDWITGNHMYANTFGMGGGVLCTFSKAIFRNTVISSNLVDSSHWGQGGGIYADHSHLELYNCSVTDNLIKAYASCGGAGLYIESSTLLLSNVSVSGNVIEGDSVDIFGVGIYCDDVQLELLNVSIDSNTATGADIHGAGLCTEYCDHPILTNVRIMGNNGGSIGGWYFGAGYYCYWADTISITNCLIALNSLGNGATWHHGGGIYVNGYTIVDIMNTTIAYNCADNGQVIGTGIYMDYTSSYGAILTIKNSILWDPNYGYEVGLSPWDYYTIVDIENSDIRDGWSGTGNLDSLPAFISSTDFHQEPNSICNNAGTLIGAPTFDLDNNSRPIPANTNPDMGCYETDQTATGYDQLHETPIAILPQPNPFSDQLSLNCVVPIDQFVTLRLRDLSGKELTKIFSGTLSRGSHQFRINTSAMAQGIYICEMQSESSSSNIKIVKQ